MNFWKEWTTINIARLNSIFSPENIEFHTIDYSDKLMLIRLASKWHIQPTYLVDSIGPDEALATINFVKNEKCLISQISAVIPALECETDYFQKTLGLSKYWKRSSYYSIALSGGSAEHVLAGMESRQRSKVRNKADSFSVEQIAFKEIHASIFAEQQIVWGVSKLNFFSSNDLMLIANKFQTKLWKITCGNSEVLYLLIIESFQEAYFFLSATTNSKAREASLFAHWKIINNLIERNYKWYHLGGGVTSGDGIERFKRSLGANEINRRLYPFTLNEEFAGNYFPNWLEQIMLPVNVKSF